LLAIKEIRKTHPKLGGRKLYKELQSFFKTSSIKMGRDAFFDLLYRNNLLIQRKKRYHITTMSKHWLLKYPNLIKDFTPTISNQLWVSDITYIKIGNRFYYISFITDAYSHKIVGYHVAESLHSAETIKALKMALRELSDSFQSHFQLIHHSDRGVQYCEQNYVKLLQNNGIRISMTQTGDPRENAIAERVNGIIKTEYLFDCKDISFREVKKRVAKAVKSYNTTRPHLSIGNHYPNFVHKNKIEIQSLWKNYKQKKLILQTYFRTQ
jgi:transposase InsO family protein